MATNSVDSLVFAILIRQRDGRALYELQAVQYPGGRFTAAPHLLATTTVESSSTGFTATCNHPSDDGWTTFTVTAPDSGPILRALLDVLTSHSQVGAASQAPVYLVDYPAFDTAEDGTQTRTISLRLVGHRRRVTLLGHVDETYPGVEGRHVEVYRYRRGNPKRATRIRFPDPGTDSLLLAAHALDHLARAHHPRPRLLARVLRRTCRD